MNVPFENADGIPHLTFYDPNENISFVWSGDFDRPIQVCPGGYGEPAAAEIDVSCDPMQEMDFPVGIFLAWFRGQCRLWVERNRPERVMITDEDLRRFVHGEEPG